MMLNKIKEVIILSIPLLIKYAFLLLFIDFDILDIQDKIEDIAFFSIILFLILFPIIKKHFYFNMIFGIYILYVILEGTSYLAVNSNFTSSYIYLLIDSNKREMEEFVSSYLNIRIIMFLALILGSFFVIRKVRLRNQGKRIFGFITVILVILILKTSGFIESNAYHNIVRGVYGYYQFQSGMQFKNNIKEEDIIVTSNNEVLVFVIGESTVRGHMSLYGYTRETNPRLSSIKNDLYLFKNVISTDILTVKSIPKIITTLDSENTNKDLFHMVEFFNAANFETYWLSNQRPISWHNNAISKIAVNTDWFKFYNHIIDRHSNQHDGILLPDFKTILNKPGKKVIFLHLLGTHFSYHRRYPKAFRKFYKKEGEQDEKKEIINHYDNAVLYNDFIVFSFIDALKKNKAKSALIYLSDHGENVYDNDTDFFGRTETNLKKNMFEIPFILWTSKNFELPIDFQYEENRSFMVDHVFQSVAHVFGVAHKSLDTKRSIFSKRFEERKRIVLNEIDFDANFKAIDEK